MTLAAGIDVGATKTGITVFDLCPHGDILVAAVTIEVKPMLTASTRRKGKKAKVGTVSTIHADVSRCMEMVCGIRQTFAGIGVKGLFIETPHGGAQGARANRLMGGATFMMATMLSYENYAFEMYSPTDVEKSLGVFVTTKEIKERGLKKGEATAWKKERIETIVRSEWPLFDKWPEAKTKAEDAFDSAAAFLCGRKANKLYARLKGM
jgi:hypothetical protein